MNSLVKFISKTWFTALVVVILVIYFYWDKNYAIYLTIIAMVLLVLSMIPFSKLRYNRMESKFFINYHRIDHIEYALKTGIRPLEAEREMSEMVGSKLLKGMVIFAKPLYIYVHPDVINEMKEYISRKVDNKQLMQIYKENCGFKSRKEIDLLVDLIREENTKE